MPVVCGLFATTALSLTCAEYKALPTSGVSPVFTQEGHLFGFPWTIEYKGEIRYDAIYLGQEDSTGQLRQPLLYVVKTARMRLGIDAATLELITVNGGEYFTVIKDDIYSYFDEQEDWKLREGDLIGASYIAGLMLVGDECSPNEPGGPFDPPGNWVVFCSDELPLHGTSGYHANAPYGELELNFGIANIGDGSCDNLFPPNACKEDEWKHRIP